METTLVLVERAGDGHEDELRIGLGAVNSLASHVELEAVTTDAFRLDMPALIISVSCPMRPLSRSTSKRATTRTLDNLQVPSVRAESVHETRQNTALG